MKCAIFVVLFWAAAAALVLASHSEAVKIGAIVIVAFSYIRVMREATLEHAFLVGVAWLVFAIVAEVFEAFTTGRGWFDLLGSPAHPLLRVALLLAWIGAPALFVRNRAC